MLRVGLDLVGSVMVLQSILGVFAIFDGAPWAIILYAAFNGLAAYLFAYGAFHHFPLGALAPHRCASRLTNAEADEFCTSAGSRPPASRFSLLICAPGRLAAFCEAAPRVKCHRALAVHESSIVATPSRCCSAFCSRSRVRHDRLGAVGCAMEWTAPTSSRLSTAAISCDALATRVSVISNRSRLLHLRRYADCITGARGARTFAA